MKKYILFLIPLILLTSCWRMPQEGEVSTLPNVNNPTLTRQQNTGISQVMPGVSY